MQVEVRNMDEQPVVTVTLSRRNLLSLLTKLEWGDESSRTLFRDCDGIMLVVKAEPDSEHYQDRTPGAMHPRTEEAIREL